MINRIILLEGIEKHFDKYEIELFYAKKHQFL
jgi:hypothetical protein